MFYELRYRIKENFLPALGAGIWMAGTAVATVVSLAKYKSILTAFALGTTSWFYLIYELAVKHGYITI